MGGYKSDDIFFVIFVTTANVQNEREKNMTYGEKITSDERFNRTGLDLLARMIYVEAEGESEMGKRAVACVARNR